MPRQRHFFPPKKIMEILEPRVVSKFGNCGFIKNGNCGYKAGKGSNPSLKSQKNTFFFFCALPSAPAPTDLRDFVGFAPIRDFHTQPRISFASRCDSRLRINLERAGITWNRNSIRPRKGGTSPNFWESASQKKPGMR